MAQPPDYNPIDLAGQEQVKAENERLEEFEVARFKDDFKWLLAHKQGRRLVWWMMGEAGVFRNPWRPSASEHSFVSGAMNQGQMLLTKIFEIAPDQFTIMLKEAHDDAKRRSGRNSE